jgi:hypothetical protein
LIVSLWAATFIALTPSARFMRRLMRLTTSIVSADNAASPSPNGPQRLPTDLQYIIMLVAGVSVFALVLSLWVVCVWGWSLHRASLRTKRHERLGLASTQPGDERLLRLWHKGKQRTTLVAHGGLPGSAMVVLCLLYVKNGCRNDHPVHIAMSDLPVAALHL